MDRLRRLQLLVWCLLFPILGTGLPRASVWQCAHAAQSITLLPASPNAMPCRMAHRTPMACCRTAPSGTPQRASLHAPPCKPTVTPAVPIPAARLPDSSLLLAAADAAPADFPPARRVLLPALTQTAFTPRGPPIPLASLAHASAHGLRAPPLS